LRVTLQKREGRPRAALGAALLACACLLTGVVTGFAQQSPAPAITFDDLYLKGQKANASLKTLTARFTEATTSSLLTAPLTAHGIIAVERPSRIVLRYQDPEVRVIVIDGNRMTLSWPDRNLRQTRDIGGPLRRVQKYFVEGSAADLLREFDVTTRIATDRPGSYELLMAPKRKQIREGLAGLDLWIERSSMLLTAMRMRFANGESKLMTFEDITINTTIDPALFSTGP
jgi:outer membrane lipoprotein-sorting protein